MMIQISQWKSTRIFLSSILATLLLAGPVLIAPVPGGGGAAWAGKFDKGGDRGGKKVRQGGGNKKARPQKSRIDRKPRASTAKQGSMRKASADRGQARPQTKPKVKQQGKPEAQKRPSGSPKDQPFARRDTGKSQPKASGSRSRENLASREQSQSQRDQIKRKQTSDRQAKDRAASKTDASRVKRPQEKDVQRQAKRDEPNRQIKEGRKNYAANKDDIRNDRKEAMEELQQNKFDHRDEAREDRQEHRDDAREDRQKHQKKMAEERRELYEDIYDDRRYWGHDDYYWDDDDDGHHHKNDDDDDDNGWLWGIGGAVIGGVAGYAIGAAVNQPPEGTVAVPVGGQQYQYYGGAFYEPAPSGTGYVTTPAPVGAQVEAPPIDCTIVFGPEDEGYCYFQGAFFIYDESADQYVVVEPPAGTTVTYLPPGYEEVTVAGTEYMKLGGTYYRPYYEGDEVTYVVSEV
jgi:hypothetical protein